MKFNDCLEESVAAGRITRAEAQHVAGQIDALQNSLTLRGEVSPEVARTQAEQAVLLARQKHTALKRRQAGLQAVRTHQATQAALAHPRGFVEGIWGLLAKDPGREARVSNIDQRATAVKGWLHAQFADAMNKMRTKNLGLSQDIELPRLMLRELMGEKTGNASAKEAATLWSGVAEAARLRFNRAGGSIPKLIDWGMPQYHDPVLVGRMGADAWIDKITPLLDRSRMINEVGIPLNDAEFRIMLEKAHNTIRTNGLSDLTPGQVGGSKLANRRQDHRVLHFKDADAWLKYHDEFGHADLYTTLTDHLNGMAHDIAKLEVLGPNPDATFRYLRDMAIKRGELDGAGFSWNNKEMLESHWNVVSGKADAVEHVMLANFAGAVRNYLTAAHLGGAMLSAISDIAFVRQTARFNGMKATKVLKRGLEIMSSADDRMFAVRAGLTADAWIVRALGGNRHVEVTGAGFSSKVSDFTMRASLLSTWTDSMRKAFGMEFMGYIADNVRRQFKDLPKPLRDTFEGYGIKASDWDVMRGTDLISYKEVGFFSVENLMKRVDLDEGARMDLTTRIQEMIFSETDFAVPVPDSRARTFTTWGKKRGTLVGELARSVGQFKSFPITIITSHLMRAARQGGWQNKAAYLGSLAVSTTVMGAVAMTMKDLARGRDPRDMTSAKFWSAAFIQGGGAGIFGDFLYSAESRFGKGFVSTVAGPGVGLVDDMKDMVVGNLYSLTHGDDTNIGREVVKFAERYSPGGSLWYARLALERAMWDQLQNAVDSKAGRGFRREKRNRRKDYGQEHWWQPGQAAPSRGPNIEALFGG